MAENHSRFIIILIIMIVIFSAIALYFAPSKTMVGGAKRVSSEPQVISEPIASESIFLNNEVNLDNQIIIYEHGEYVTPDGKFIPFFEEKVFVESYGAIPVKLRGNLPLGVSLKQLEGFHDTGQNVIKVDVTQTVSLEASSAPAEAITGSAVYNPQTPFNRRNIRIAIISPFNDDYPLPQNYADFILPILAKAKQFYLDNSDRQTIIEFDLYPVAIAWWDPYYSLDAYSVIKEADPVIDYSQYTLVMFVYKAINQQSGSPAGGWASLAMDANDNPYYYKTGDGLLPSAVASYFSDFTNQDWFYHELVVIHEIGHILSFWNPDVSKAYYGGPVPHAAGPYFLGDDPMHCRQNGDSIFCEPYGYGDATDVMGTMPGSFHYHQRAFFMGLSPVSKVQKVTSSGNYRVCEVEREVASCPQELLIMNPVGNNLAIELRSNTGPETFFQCSNEYFDGVFVRVVDREEGGGLGPYFYKPTVLGGDVILPYDFAIEPSCSSVVLRKYPVKVGGVMSTPLADIEVLSMRHVNDELTFPRMADVKITMKAVQCVPSPPEALLTYVDDQRFSGSEITLYSDTLQPTMPFIPRLTVTNMDVCNTGKESFQITTTVPSIQATKSILSPDLPPLKSQNHDLPIPEALKGKCGRFPFTTTVAKVSNPSHKFSISNTFRLIGQNCPCEDSDNGLNYYEVGTATDYTGDKQDYCANMGAVWEYFCSRNIAEVQKQYYKCQYGRKECSKGACKV